MSAAAFRIYPEWPDTMVCETGDGRSLRFDCLSMDEPPQVLVPAPRHWAASTPAWAHGEREAIVAQLRAAGCLVAEEDGASTTLLSPDASIRVEHERVHDDRSALQETIRLVALPGGEVLAHVLNYGGFEPVRFPRTAAVVVELTDGRSRRRRIDIDAPSRTFRLLPDGGAEPLRALADRLERGDDASAAPAVAAVAPRPQAMPGRVLDAIAALGGLLLAAGGLWLAFAGRTDKEQWTGLLGAVFFGACGVASLRGRR